MILILSSHEDLHAQAVAQTLTSMGEAHRMVDLREFPTRMQLNMRYGDTSDFELVFADAARIHLRDVKSVWWRRPQMFVPDERIQDAAHRQFVLSESATAFQGLWQCGQALWINDPHKDAAASHKPWQLELARRVGLHTPETLITNDPDEARAFWDAHDGRVIYKGFIASLHAWRETRVLQQAERTLAESVRFAPVIFQEFVPGIADLRVTVIGDQVFAAAMTLKPEDYAADVRMNLHNNYQAHELPEDLRSKLLTFMRTLGLEYGAVDFRLTPDGEYVFFEVNPAGQFLYVEHATQQPITQALANRLALTKTNDQHSHVQAITPDALVEHLHV